MLEPWSWEVAKNDKEMFQKLILADPACGIVLKERYPWDTPTESCESDMTEVEVMQFRAPPSLPDPPIEETRIRESMLGCQIDVTSKAESRLHPMYKQMKDARPFEAIVGDKSSSELSDRSASILSWNAGQKRGKTANCVVGPFHMILVQETETHCHEIVTRAKQQFHIHQGADQVVLCNNTFEPESARIQEEILGTSKQDSCGLRYLLAKSRFERWPKQGGSTYTAVSAHLSNTAARRRDVAKLLQLSKLRKITEDNCADIIAGDFNSSACRERGKHGKRRF